MNEEKVIAMLRAFGLVAHREMMTPYQLCKTFDIQWPVAKRWCRILSAIPNDPVPDDIFERLSDRYYEIDKVRKDKYDKPVSLVAPANRDLYGFPGIIDHRVPEFIGEKKEAEDEDR